MLVVVCGGFFARRAWFLTRLVRQGKPNDRRADVPRQVQNEVELVLGQRKLLQRLVPGLMHAFIFWGFLVLFPTIVLAAIAAAGGHVRAPEWYRVLSDVFACLVLAGVVTAFVIRKVVRPARFAGSHLGEADLILAMIALVVLTLLGWHHIGGTFFVWAHLVVIGAFLAYLPYSKHLHIATAAVNVWFARTRQRGRLEPLRFDVPDDEMRFGAATIFDLTRKEVLDGFSCTECGRCQDACPAYATGKILSPKLLIMGIRDQVFAQSTEPIIGNGVPEQSIWDCVTCGACVEACPGLDRAHRSHRRSAPESRHGRFEVSGRGGADAARRRACEQPVGQAADGARCLGRRAGRARARAGRRSAGIPLLGRLRGVVRRAGEEVGGVDREAPAEGGRRLRDPRPARGVHRRSRRGGWATSTCSRRTRSRTCRR